MYADPQEERRALAENYRSMADEQLTDLAEDFADLRPAAQQALRDEMKLRKLGDPESKDWHRHSAEPIAWSQIENGDEGGVEFTWKTPLCECDSSQEAWQISEVLRRARIESWLEGQRGSSAGSALRIMVAADQLEEAQRVIANPIPADIVAASQVPSEEYDLPVCPKCGTTDPILVDVEPVNAWECESCGAEWTEPA